MVNLYEVMSCIFVLFRDDERIPSILSIVSRLLGVRRTLIVVLYISATKREFGCYMCNFQFSSCRCVLPTFVLSRRQKFLLYEMLLCRSYDRIGPLLYSISGMGFFSARVCVFFTEYRVVSSACLMGIYDPSIFHALCCKLFYAIRRPHNDLLSLKKMSNDRAILSVAAACYSHGDISVEGLIASINVLEIPKELRSDMIMTCDTLRGISSHAAISFFYACFCLCNKIRGLA